MLLEESRAVGTEIKLLPSHICRASVVLNGNLIFSNASSTEPSFQLGAVSEFPNSLSKLVDWPKWASKLVLYHQLSLESSLDLHFGLFVFEIFYSTLRRFNKFDVSFQGICECALSPSRWQALLKSFDAALCSNKAFDQAHHRAVKGEALI